MKSKSQTCKISVKDSKLVIEGKCAEKLSRLDRALFKLSRIMDREISIYKCIDPSTAKVKRMMFDTIGSSTATRLTQRRVCPLDEIQHSLHTHQRSGIPKFSPTDRNTLNYRLESKMDNCGCVAGHKETKCLCEISYEWDDNPSSHKVR